MTTGMVQFVRDLLDEKGYNGYISDKEIEKAIDNTAPKDYAKLMDAFENDDLDTISDITGLDFSRNKRDHDDDCNDDSRKDDKNWKDDDCNDDPCKDDKNWKDDDCNDDPCKDDKNWKDDDCNDDPCKDDKNWKDDDCNDDPCKDDKNNDAIKPPKEAPQKDSGFDFDFSFSVSFSGDSADDFSQLSSWLGKTLSTGVDMLSNNNYFLSHNTQNTTLEQVSNGWASSYSVGELFNTAQNVFGFGNSLVRETNNSYFGGELNFWGANASGKQYVGTDTGFLSYNDNGSYGFESNMDIFGGATGFNGHGHGQNSNDLSFFRDAYTFFSGIDASDSLFDVAQGAFETFDQGRFEGSIFGGFELPGGSSIDFDLDISANWYNFDGFTLA